MAQEPDDEFLISEFEAARQYIQEHPEFALCRVRHDVRIHEPPADIAFHDDGGWTFIYNCHGCDSEYRRRHWADGRFRGGTWKYADGYRAPEGSGYALTSRSGKAAFALTLRDTFTAGKQSRRKGRR